MRCRCSTKKRPWLLLLLPPPPPTPPLLLLLPPLLVLVSLMPDADASTADAGDMLDDDSSPLAHLAANGLWRVRPPDGGRPRRVRGDAGPRGPAARPAHLPGPAPSEGHAGGSPARPGLRGTARRDGCPSGHGGKGRRGVQRPARNPTARG